ncbi:hypothetical protein HN51_011028, partial [Arachis hypogaea]
DKFGVRSLRHSPVEMMATLYLQIKLCKNQGNGMGLDWCNLALQFSDLCAS